MAQPLTSDDVSVDALPERSPRTKVDSTPLPTDSMVTVSLSEADPTETPATPRVIPAEDEDDILQREQNLFSPVRKDSETSLPPVVSGHEEHNSDRESSEQDFAIEAHTSKDGSQVDWETLDQTERDEMKDERSDEATALLLARLEQENQRIAKDPKAGIQQRDRSESRPPSLQQLRKMLDQDPGAVRFSQIPSPPPMTQLEFWAALTSNYPGTAQRLPTLTSNKIRGGLPDPLRGQIWLSMAGARDQVLEEKFNYLSREASPHELQIGKDVGRSFPNHAFFKSPESLGQRSLSNVLKVFSIYDPEIGYCQGLGFPVGTLLKNMGEREAFCVLVRLMQEYDLRSCFLPELPGLHLRVYQFQELLKQHLPNLASHLDELSLQGADYMTQWCLSLFAAHCPDSMLFRIYDVMFAEGASETIMRVALSLMRKNEERLLNCDYEEAMAILLGSRVWEPYGVEPDAGHELVNDFTSFTGVVTCDILTKLEESFEAQKLSKTEGEPSPGVASAASRFFNKLWITTPTFPIKQSLSPGIPPANPQRRSSGFMLLRRTPSKQSLTSTIDSVGVPSNGTTSFVSEAPTQATSISRSSSGEMLSMKSPTEKNKTIALSKDSEMHQEIEDLLVALSERQRENALLAAQVQKMQEDRSEDHRVIRTLLERLKQPRSPSPSLADARATRRRTTVTAGYLGVTTPSSLSQELPDDVQTHIVEMNSRFALEHQLNRKSSTLETKTTLRESLERTREQLHAKSTQCDALMQQLEEEKCQSSTTAKALKDAQHRLQDYHNKADKMEQTIQDLKRSDRRPSSHMWSDSSAPPSLTRTDTSDSTMSSGSGLRELRLGRTPSARNSPTITTIPKRGSSLIAANENHSPMNPDALLIELVSAKTAEASAKQELEELKNKFESLRRVMNGGAPTPPTPQPVKETPAAAGGGGFWGWGRRTASTSTVATVTP